MNINNALVEVLPFSLSLSQCMQIVYFQSLGFSLEWVRLSWLKVKDEVISVFRKVTSPFFKVIYILLTDLKNWISLVDFFLILCRFNQTA